MRLRLALAFALLAVTAGLLAAAEPGAAPALEPLKPPTVNTNVVIRELEGGILQLRDLRIDRAKRTVTFPGKVNLREDLIEYLLVCSAGKLHESVFSTPVEPFEIHTAMLLLGARGSPNWQPNDEDDSKVLKGDQIRVWVEWKNDDKTTRLPGDSFIVIGKDRKPAEPGLWIYNGSWKWGNRFIAQEERSVVAIISDPAALVNNPRPERSDDEIWFARTQTLPPLGTDVSITFELVKTATWK